jgi:hypothetical protein
MEEGTVEVKCIAYSERGWRTGVDDGYENIRGLHDTQCSSMKVTFRQMKEYYTFF